MIAPANHGERLAPRLGPTPVYEVDHPATAARKARMLGARAGAGAFDGTASVRRVAADLMHETVAQALARVGVGHADHAHAGGHATRDRAI